MILRPGEFRVGSVVGDELGGGVIVVRVVDGAARRRQHHVGVPGELGHLATAS